MSIMITPRIRQVLPVEKLAIAFIYGKDRSTLAKIAATLGSGTNADDRLRTLMMRHEGHESHEEGRQDLEKT